MRNDQLIRQWFLLQQLDAARGKTLQELAEALPNDYPKHARTIRRDLEALMASGFPLLTERREGRTHWRLIDGYRTRLPLCFSPPEVMAMAFARHLLQPLEGTQIQSALQSAIAKAETGLPATEGLGLSDVQSVFSFMGKKGTLPFFETVMIGAAYTPSCTISLCQDAPSHPPMGESPGRYFLTDEIVKKVSGTFFSNFPSSCSMAGETNKKGS